MNLSESRMQSQNISTHHTFLERYRSLVGQVGIPHLLCGIINEIADVLQAQELYLVLVILHHQHVRLFNPLKSNIRNLDALYITRENLFQFIFFVWFRQKIESRFANGLYQIRTICSVEHHFHWPVNHRLQHLQKTQSFSIRKIHVKEKQIRLFLFHQMKTTILVVCLTNHPE